jgi:hypothetical protein
MKSLKEVVQVLILGLSIALWATVSNGCAAAAVGAGGAAAGIAYTSRGAEGHISGSPADVDRRAHAVFQQMGITPTENVSKDGGKEKKLVGKTKDREVTVEINKGEGGTSKVEVVANKGPLNMGWDKDYAKDVLTRIVRQG